MLTKKKKIIILSLMVTLLVATGIINVWLNRTPSVDAGGSGLEAGDFFVNYRADRISTRNQTIEYYDAIIANAASTEQEISDATAKKMEIAGVMERELVLEGLIKAFGFEDCVVTMSTNNINVLLKVEELTEEEVAQILYTIVSETGSEATAIKLVPVL